MKLSEIDLTGKRVIVKASELQEPYEEPERVFICLGGFGLKPQNLGKTVYGKWQCDETRDSISRMMIERVLEDHEYPAPAQETENANT